MAVNKWLFQDLVTLDEYQFEINPNDGAAPSRQKRTTQSSSSAPGALGKPLLFEGRDDLDRFDFSGTLLTQAQFDALNEWYDKRYLVRVTDDFLIERNIYIEGVSFKRLRKHNHPWAHTFDVKALWIR